MDLKRAAEMRPDLTDERLLRFVTESSDSIPMETVRERALSLHKQRMKCSFEVQKSTKSILNEFKNEYFKQTTKENLDAIITPVTACEPWVVINDSTLWNENLHKNQILIDKKRQDNQGYMSDRSAKAMREPLHRCNSEPTHPLEFTNFSWNPYAPIANLTGTASFVVPAGFSSTNRPFGTYACLCDFVSSWIFLFC
jgi:hypothetical protein